MNPTSPNLLTLLHWATRLAAGEQCAEWEAWCAASPEAAGKWERITQAQQLLAGGIAAEEEVGAISAELLAAYIEGGLDRAEAERIEQQLWQSPELLAEALSSLRFAASAPETLMTEQLEQRLAALAPQSMNGHAQAAPVLYRLAPPETKKSNWLAPIDRPMTAVVLPESGPAVQAPAGVSRRPWLVMAAALLIVATLGGAIGFLTLGRRTDGDLPVAKSPEIRKPAPEEPRQGPIVPPPVAPPETLPAQPAPIRPADAKIDPLTKSSESAPPAAKTIPAVAPPAAQPPLLPIRIPPTPEPTPSPIPAPRRALPPSPELAFESVQGILLMDTGNRGKWQVAKDRHALSEPLKMLSLAESWTTAEVPGVATLVCEGSTELALSRLIDGVLEVRLDHGRVGIREIADGAEIRVLVADAAWTARGLEPHSTLAVFHDPLSPGIAVPQGSIALDDAPVATRQFLRWQQDHLLPFDVLTSPSAADPNAPPPAAPLIHAWDLEWLTPPDESQRKQWQAVHGRLIDRLAEANDFEAELTRMLATSRDNRHAALLARWSATSEPPSSRVRRIWNMLRERRAPVRVAGVISLLELPPGDLRREELVALVGQATNPVTRGHVVQWLDATRQPAPLAQTQAAELARGLTHEELAVRQIAASLLELHTTTALLQAGRLPPMYDAAGPAPRRVAAQQEWQTVLRQLYTAARNANGALGPATIKPIP